MKLGNVAIAVLLLTSACSKKLIRSMSSDIVKPRQDEKLPIVKHQEDPRDRWQIKLEQGHLEVFLQDKLVYEKSNVKKILGNSNSFLAFQTDYHDILFHIRKGQMKKCLSSSCSIKVSKSFASIQQGKKSGIVFNKDADKVRQIVNGEQLKITISDDFAAISQMNKGEIVNRREEVIFQYSSVEGRLIEVKGPFAFTQSNNGDGQLWHIAKGRVANFSGGVGTHIQISDRFASFQNMEGDGGLVNHKGEFLRTFYGMPGLTMKLTDRFAYTRNDLNMGFLYHHERGLLQKVTHEKSFRFQISKTFAAYSNELGEGQIWDYSGTSIKTFEDARNLDIVIGNKKAMYKTSDISGTFSYDHSIIFK